MGQLALTLAASKTPLRWALGAERCEGSEVPVGLIFRIGTHRCNAMRKIAAAGTWYWGQVPPSGLDRSNHRLHILDFKRFLRNPR